MREGQFESLRLELLRRGVTPAYVERTVLELEEHYTDLESAALASGVDADEAARLALATLGNERAIAAAILAQPALLTFSTRPPRVAQYLTLPGLPRMFCIEQRPELTSGAPPLLACPRQKRSRHSYGCTVFSGFQT